MATDTLNHNSELPAQNNARPKRSLWSKSIRFVLWSLLILVLLIAVILGLIYFLAGTDNGFARVSNIASERVPGLVIEKPQGNLREGIAAQNVIFVNDTINIKASKFSSDWTLGCLVQRTFCLDDVHIEQLDITTMASENTEPATPREGPIELPPIDLPLDIIISDVSIGTLTFQAPGDAPAQRIEDIQLSAHTDGSQLTIDNLSLAYPALTITSGLKGDIDLQGDYPLNLSLDINARDMLPDTLPEGEGNQALDVSMQLNDSLANLNVDTRISGLADIQVNANIKALHESLPATVTLTSDELGWPVNSKSIIEANDTLISITGDMSDYDVSLQTSLAGEQIPDTDINIAGKANTERVSIPDINIDTLGGTANASALVTLVQPMQWSTRWKLLDIDPSRKIPDLNGMLNGDINASGMISDGQWSLKLEQALFTGKLRELPFRLDAKLAKGINDVWFIERVILNNDNNQIHAQGFVNDKLDIRADINLPQLQNLMPGLAGGFNANLVAAGPVENPDIKINADADVIRFNDVLVQALAIDGDISQLFENASTLNITVDTVRAGENSVSDAALSLSGKRRDHQLTFIADGPQGTDLDLSISGDLDDAMNWSGLLGKLQATVPGHEVQLTNPIAIDWQNEKQNLSVAPHCWSISGTSNLCLENQIQTDREGQASISLDQYSLDQLNPFLPDKTKLAGNLTSNVELIWGEPDSGDQKAQISATIDQAKVQTVDALGDPVTLGYDTINLDADVAADDVRANLALNSTTLGNATITAQLDPSDKLSALTGSLTLDQLQVSAAKAFLPDFDAVNGTLSAQGDLGGTLTAPEFNGDVILDSPQLRADILPLPITGGKITARIDGQNMNIIGDILSDDGRIAVTGRGLLEPENWNAEVNLRGKGLTVVAAPLEDSTINHNITIVANAKRVSVTGNLDIPQADIDVAELPAGAATVSSDIVIIEDEEEKADQPSPASTMNLAVALDVSLGDDVAISAYGLDANLTGEMDVRIRGNRPPQLGGEIRVVDGIFKKYGQDLEANGQIIFVGPIDSTRLAIDAVREIENEDRSAGLRIEGTVATPEITLFTDPADKSQDAILSYIILGRDINQASDQEADLMATAVLALAVQGGSRVGGGVANALGIKEFGLETRGSGNNAELIVTGRLNDQLLLRYGQDVFESGSTLYLRYDLTKKLYVEAATALGAATQDAVDLFYSFSF